MIIHKTLKVIWLVKKEILKQLEFIIRKNGELSRHYIRENYSKIKKPSVFQFLND